MEQQKIRTILDVKKTGALWQFRTDSGMNLQVSAVSDSVWKVWLREENESVPVSHTIAEDVEEKDLLVLSETETHWCLESTQIQMKLKKAGATLGFYDRESGALILQTCPEEYFNRTETGSFYLDFCLTEKEKLYGLGEDNDVPYGRLNRRGTLRDMVTGQRINKHCVTADYPIPFLLSVGGSQPYGLYLDTSYHLRADLGKSREDRCRFFAEGGPCCFYFIGGGSLTQVHQNYTALIGRPALPPLWVLGYMQSKCSFKSWEEIDDVIASFQKERIPLDSIVFDFDWAEYFNNYKWNKKWKGLSPQKIQEYRSANGIHFMASNSGPMLKSDSDTYESAVQNGVLARDEEGNTITCGHYSGELIDFTNPVTETWMEPQLGRIMEDGIEAWWLDLTEPEGEGENTRFHLGHTSEIHNVYSRYTSDLYHRIMKKKEPQKRSFVLTRAGTAGIQKYPTALWSGDVYSEYGTLQAHVPEALNTCLSGIAMWTSDSGGFISSTGNEKYPYNLYQNDRTMHSLLFERWMQFSCFTPIMRAHHAGGEAVPFAYPDIMTDGMRRYIRLRYQLIPYIYSLYYEAYLHGTPIMRPLFWNDPEDETAQSAADEYLFGDWLLIAPVLEEKQTYRDVYLPSGIWYDWDYGYAYQGGQSVRVYAPQNRIPVFVKAGAVIPMADDVMCTDDLDWSRLQLQIYPYGESKCRIYTDDGVSEQYRQGDYTVTTVSCEQESDEVLKIHAERSSERYPVKELILKIHIEAEPKQVLLNGTELEWTERYYGLKCAETSVCCYDEFKRLLYVKVTAHDTLQLEIRFDTQRTFLPYLPDKDQEEEGQLTYVYPAPTLPCVILAEQYDRGGEGVAYHKNSTENGTVFREDNAGIVSYSDEKKGYYVQNLSSGEWIEYTVLCQEQGEFQIHMECRGTGELSFAVNSQIATGYIPVDRKEWGQLVTEKIHIAQGEQIIGLRVHAGAIDFGKIKIRNIS